MFYSKDITDDITEDTPVAPIVEGDEDQILFLDGSQRRGDFNYNIKAQKISRRNPRGSIVHYIKGLFR
jgi:hypothetical protein